MDILEIPLNPAFLTVFNGKAQLLSSFVASIDLRLFFHWCIQYFTVAGCPSIIACLYDGHFHCLPVPCLQSTAGFPTISS